MRFGTLGALVAAAAAMAPGRAAEAPARAARPVHEIRKATGPIVVDGVLDDAAWRDALLLELAVETHPGENLPARVRTECRLAFGGDALYVAFHALDPEPQRIRARLTDRDRAYMDDFVGVVLDTFDDARRGYELFANPFGVQMDLVQDDVAGTENDAWDAIWSSAGRITAEGYDVEMAIPFVALRFPRGSGRLTWGIDAVRIYPRDRRYQFRLAPMDRNVTCYLCQVGRITGLEGIAPGRNIELDPTLTGTHTDVRAEGQEGLGDGSTKGDLGLTALWGVTPNLNLAATVNPDFSQVEADAAQLAVNTPFALFYPEKRPFFLEAGDTFTTPLGVVFTRNVADPLWGARLTGKVGPLGFGLFVAEDEVTNVILPGPESSSSVSLDTPSLDAVARLRADLGAGSTLGFVATAREGDDLSSELVGLDGLFRLGDKDTITGQVLLSRTEYGTELAREQSLPGGSLDDYGLTARYEHGGRDLTWYLSYEDLGDELRADMGFLPQVGYRYGTAGANRIWTGTDETFYSRANVGAGAERREDQEGALLDQRWSVWGSLNGPRQSYFSMTAGLRDRSFQAVPFDDQWFVTAYAECTPNGFLSGSFNVQVADAVDYANVREGRLLDLYPYVTLTPGRHLQLDLGHRYQDFDVDAGRLYLANLTELRAAYQFDLRTLVRAIVQYTDIRRDPALYEDAVERRSRDLFGQLLFSYKLNPRTVLFVGLTDGYAEVPELGLTEMERTAFVKLGYAWIL